MHMADALLSPAVAGVMYAASGIAAGLSVRKLKQEEKLHLEESAKKLPVMAVMSAFVFAGQMVNYSIPGTGSSGHICGGMLLTALLGPWAGFLSMTVILTIQCLFFADGGLMALGANIWNMAFYGCFVGYFLIYRPILRSALFHAAPAKKLILASVLGCVLTLQLGAFSIVLETSLSGITELPFGAFCAIMQPIHLAIGLVEGVITAAVLLFVHETRPELLQDVEAGQQRKNRVSFRTSIAVFAVVAALIGGGLSLAASGDPDGLEWSLFGNREAGYAENMGLQEDDFGMESAAADAAASLRERTAILPDYAFAADGENPAGTAVSGLTGSAMVAVAAVVICLAGGFFRKKSKQK